VSLAVSGTLTDGGTDGVSITPFPNSDTDGDGIPEMVSGSAGLGSLVHLLDVGPASSAAGAYGPFSVGPIAGPTGPLDQMSLLFSFTLSGGGDTAVLSATLTIDEAPNVPWAASLWLVAAGIGTLALGRRRFV
jgi:hypothetical protein